MTNKSYLYSVRDEALSSLYWSRKEAAYKESQVYGYAPMIEDELFISIADEREVIGVEELESRLGRRLKIEELKVCPLSVNYLLFGNPIVTETDRETETIKAFHALIRDRINRYEDRTRRQYGNR